jgi:alanine racemase
MYPTLTNRPVWIEVDIDQLRANLAYVRARADEKAIWAVVKSDAYNHGLEGVFTTFIAARIAHFCVGNFDEAVQLQSLADAAGEQITILIFGLIPYDKLSIIRPNWHVTISSLHMLTQYSIALEANPEQMLHVHLKIDSGMNRRGFKGEAEFATAWRTLQVHGQYDVVGLYTHFSTADSDVPFMKGQVGRFLDIVGTTWHDVQYVHAQNSYGLLHLGEEAAMFNVIRVGGICYGLSGQRRTDVQPIFSLYGEIIEVKAVKKGETISYGNTHTFTRDGYVGVIPLGYADGWRRINTNLDVYIGEQSVQIVGTICMEQLMVFSPDACFAPGDTVTFIGGKSDLFAVAHHNEITDYELICSFLARIPRKYITKGKGRFE